MCQALVAYSREQYDEVCVTYVRLLWQKCCVDIWNVLQYVLNSAEYFNLHTCVMWCVYVYSIMYSEVTTHCILQ